MIFIPELHHLREKYNCHDEALVIMDGLKAHENLIENKDSEAKKIFFRFLVAHMSDQTQPLDIGLFAIMKRYEQNYTIIQDLSQQNNQLIKITKCFYKAAIPYNCKTAFRASGIISEIKYNKKSKIEIAKFDLQKYQSTTLVSFNISILTRICTISETPTSYTILITTIFTK